MEKSKSNIPKNVIIGNNVKIEPQAILGYGNDEETIIEDGCYVGPYSIIYGGVHLKKNVKVWANTIIRAKTIIDENSKIGNLVILEGNLRVGKFVSIFSQNHITAFTIIEDYVFIGPNCTTTNTRKINYQRDFESDVDGIKIRRGARIGGGVTFFPGIEVGEQALVAAGSLLTRNVPPFSIVLGSPARVFGKVPEEEYLNK
ncbi:MAG: DapH/DapD/GlmU-related protein [Promethearchaeota archaeon]